jgi:hypothetical protein
MAEPLLPPQTAPLSNWEDQFTEDSSVAVADWENQFLETTASSTDSWEDQFATDANAVPANWEDAFAEPQGPVETFARTAAQDLGSLATGAVSGLGRWFENLSGVANQAVPGLGDVLDYAPQSALFQALAPVADDLRQETQAVYNPDAQRNPIAATIGGGVGQALGMIPMVATGGTPLVLGAAAASGFGEGSQTAEDLGVQNPAGQMALGVGFGAAETLVERLGGIGAGPVRAAGEQAIRSLGGQALRTVGSEAIEEPITGALQDVGSVTAAATVQDPNRPGFTITGQPIAPLLPNDPAYWSRRGKEAIGGAAGGTVFAGLGLLANRGQTQASAATVEGDFPGTPAPPPSRASVEVGGVRFEYDAQNVTPDQVQQATPEVMAQLQAAGLVREVSQDANAPFMPPAQAPAPVSGGGAVPGAVVADPNPAVVAGPTVAEAQETLGDLGNVGSRAAPASTVGRAGPAPLPRDVDGNLDLLNYLNENPIRAPRRGTEGASADQFEWREAGDFDPAFRSRIMQEGRSNIDDRAQEAYNLGFIPEPTAAALADGVREVIAKRQQQRRQGPGQARVMSAMEQAQQRFEQGQQTLRTQGQGQPIDLDEIRPGTTLIIQGELVTVADVEIDDMGRTTRALLSTPAGTVRVTPESGLRSDIPTVKKSLTPAPRGLADINAELAAWADATIQSGRGQFSAGIDPTLMAAYTVKGAQLIAQGFTTFGRWSAEMLRRFGEAVRQYLRGAWDAARKTSEVGAINLGARISAREPTMAEDMAGQTRESQFGERVQADARLSPEVRARAPGQFAVMGDEQVMNAVAAVMRETPTLEGAGNRFRFDDSLPMPVRIAGLSRVALNHDAQASALKATGQDPEAADRATESAIAAVADLERFANEAGRNLRIFSLWLRMSPEGQLRRVDKRFEKTNSQTVAGDVGVSPTDTETLVEEELRNLDTEAIIAEALADGAPQVVNLRTGEESMVSRLLGGAERLARSVSESGTVQSMVKAIDDVLRALSGRLFADPLLLTPMGQAVLQATRTLLLQGQKLAAAVANAIADVRTRLNDPTIADAALARAVTQAVTKEVLAPVLRKLAFDAAYNRREAVADLLAVGVGIMEAGRLADAIIAKRPKIAKIAQAKVREAVMRRLQDRPRKRARLQKLPAIIDTMMQAVGAGFDTRGTFLKAWQDKYKLPSLSTAQRDKLKAMAAEMNRLPVGVLRQKAAIAFMSEVAMIEGIPAKDLLLAAWYANLLSGPSTQAINVAGNGFLLLLKSFPLMVASPREAGKYLRGLARGLAAGKLEAGAVLREGTTFRPGKFSEAQANGALDMMMAQGPRTLAEWTAWVTSLGGVTRIFPRLLSAADALFFYSSYEGMTAVATARLLRQGGLTPGTVAYNAEFVRQVGGDPVQWAADLDQATQELQAAGQTPKRTDVNRRAWEIRRSRRSFAVQDLSQLWAERMTFTQAPEGVAAIVIDGIIGQLQKIDKFGIPFGRMFLAPFRGIVVNAADALLDFTPIGIVRGLQSSRFTGKNQPRRQMEAVERRERILTGLMGTAIGYAIYAMAAALADEDDVTVPFMLYGMGPPNKEARALLQEMGWRPYTVKVGGRYWSYAETPLGGILAAFGHALDSLRYPTGTPKTTGERLQLALMAAIKGFTRQGTLSQVADAVDVLNGDIPANSLVSTAVRPVTAFIPMQGLLRDVSTIFDPTKISDDDVHGAMVKDVPIFKSMGTKPAINWKGEPMQIQGAPVVRRFTNQQKLDPETAFLGINRVTIPKMPEIIPLGKYVVAAELQGMPLVESYKRRGLTLTALENGMMTEEQQYRFAKRSGALTAERVTALRREMIARHPNGRLPVAFKEDLQTRINAITEAARRRAMMEEVERAQ